MGDTEDRNTISRIFSLLKHIVFWFLGIPYFLDEKLKEKIIDLISDSKSLVTVLLILLAGTTLVHIVYFSEKQRWDIVGIFVSLCMVIIVYLIFADKEGVEEQPDYEYLVLNNTVEDIKEKCIKKDLDMKSVLLHEKSNKDRETLKKWLKRKID